MAVAPASRSESEIDQEQMTKLRGPNAPLPAIHPNPSDLINVRPPYCAKVYPDICLQLLPPAAHRDNPSTSICDHYVHTSVNKERSPTRVVKVIEDEGFVNRLVLTSCSGHRMLEGY